MSDPKIPFLPGNSFPNLAQHDFRKPHSLGYVNGYATQPQPILGIGLQQLSIATSATAEELLARIGSDPNLVYGNKRFFAKEPANQFVPAHVAFDKVVLRFDGYFKETVHESQEQYHLRVVRILFFLEDDSIAVVEPPVENSGIAQGVLIKRQLMPKNEIESYGVHDFNLATNITFYGKTFRIVSCDKFTQKYLTETENMKLNNPEPMPIDAFVVSRQRPAKKHMGPVKHDKLNRFLENDRKVLRFFCIWDDTDSMFGELREFVLHYHLVDDSIEVREVQKTNSGRDPFPILLRRQQLPKGLHELSETQETEKYTWKDLRIGGVLNVLGRPFLLRDCDGYTRKFYNENLNISMESMKAIPAESSAPVKPEIVYPPYNGFGTVEDSMGSCKYLVLQPPKKDFIKLLANENKVLRFVARMVTSHREDQDRRFVINYHLADDTMTIHEPPQRNAGIIGGKFMERTRVLQPGSALSDQSGPVYYDVKHLYVGGKIEVLSHSFVLLDADEYAFNFMEADPARFKYSDRNACNQKILGAIRSLDSSRLQALVDALIKCDRNLVGFVDRQALVATSKAYLPESITEHEIVTFARQFEDKVRKTNYVKLINSI